MVEALGLSLTEFVFYVINFLILVGLLTKFLYRPFLNMLETRKQSIQDALDNAELINRRADEKMENYDRQIVKLEEQGREIIKEAKERAEKQADEIIEEAHSKANSIIVAAERQVELEKQKALEEMKQQVATLALLAAEKIVERSIAQVGQDQIVDEIIEQAGKRQWQN
ncbi:F0F1 ATP synthase subunit B [Zhenpiania hominis]|uniref:ATP synthase subunit b n=1 Tax=Zhenpiania hominis TaxID=2763644 RepID=A0A923NQP5_9FIRM|nr:F0F1 ATP synthase subunit B [Zhenpiania hominis]MBC6680348.1 F0F1 ATP synthase subunit B [Zhenpiania hominis]